MQAFQQFQEVLQIISSPPKNDDHDSWTYIWRNFFFSSKSVYQHLIGHPEVDPIFKWIWKSSCEPKHKVFFWLLVQDMFFFCDLVQDRLSTRNLLKRKNMFLPSYDCSVEETIAHLFLECSVARDCWSLINLTVISSPNCVMEIIIIMCWCIWGLRNDFIFRGIQVNSLRGLTGFKEIFRQLLWRAKKKYFPAIELWIDHLV